MATVTLSKHPVFESITGLTNTTFDPDNYQEDRMATEAQIAQIERAIGDLQARKEHCCREIVTWRSYVRVIAQDTGIVVSDWLDNMQVGSARRGEQFTVEFALPLDGNRFVGETSIPNGNPESTATTPGFYSNLAVRVNEPGRTLQIENCLYARDVGVAKYNTTTYPFTMSNGIWPCGSGDNTLILIKYNGDHQLLPIASNNTNAEGLYYIYKDQETNKIKIDVKRLDQFAGNEYLALFFTQFVQRREYS